MFSTNYSDFHIGLTLVGYSATCCIPIHSTALLCWSIILGGRLNLVTHLYCILRAPCQSLPPTPLPSLSEKPAQSSKPLKGAPLTAGDANVAFCPFPSEDTVSLSQAFRAECAGPASYMLCTSSSEPRSSSCHLVSDSVCVCETFVLSIGKKKKKHGLI